MPASSNPQSRDLHPGTVVEICFPLFKHYAIVTDRTRRGRPTLIGLSYRTGSVTEEPWHAVAGDRPVRVSDIHGDLPGAQVIKRARACINQPQIRWNLFTSNCEHFVRGVHGLPAESPQVRNAVGGALLGMAAAIAAPQANALRVLGAAPCGALLRMWRFAQARRR